MRYLSKTISLLLLTTVIFSFNGICQQKPVASKTITTELNEVIPIPTTSYPKKIPDTTKGILLPNIIEFNNFLKKSISYDDYMKLTPENTLQQLWLWWESKNKPHPTNGTNQVQKPKNP